MRLETVDNLSAKLETSMGQNPNTVKAVRAQPKPDGYVL
jgi:hypothetical protein